ncbi:MAG TPA: serine/threonine-protein kinase [Blastocatellia bacterium]|nr:serine/threonine-protein kinase [Blastocatellia bacterium]
MKICTNCGSPVPLVSERCPQCGASANGYRGRLTGATLAEKYLVEELLGSGGMCDVYRARHIAMEKEVAIKILKPELAADPRIAQRFEQEARAASRVRHPHAINVTDYGIGRDNTPFLVMELVEGCSLREVLREHGALSVERVAGILHQVCSALEAAHSVGVIHRDIKPDNIIISELEGRDWVEVVDFGVAKIQEDVNRRASLTGANFIIGTPRYMSPEQCEEKEVDARSDIYSLGVVVYEMLTGDAPFEASSSTRLLMAHVAEPPAPLRDKRPDISPEVEAVVMRALEKNPDRRPQSAMKFAREFEQAAGIENLSRGETTGFQSRSRFSVPLDDFREAGDATDVEDEETIVRRRADEREDSAALDGTLEDYDERDLYDTMPDEPHPQAPDYPATSAGKSRSLIEDARAMRSTRPSRITSRDTRPEKRRGNVTLMISLFVLSAIIGFVAFAVLSNRSTPQVAQSNQLARDNQTAAANSNAGSQLNQQTDNTEVTSPVEPSDATTQVDTGKVRDEVTSTIGGWIASLETRNVNAHMQYYAPTLHTYFLKNNVDRSVARAEIADALSRYSKLAISTGPIEVRVDPSGEEAIATFEKRWDFDGAQVWSGSTVERVWLKKTGNRWFITGVKDLR